MTIQNGAPVCAAARQGRELAHVIERHEKLLDALCNPDDPDLGEELRAQIGIAVMDVIGVLDRRISEATARTAEGAVFQLIVISDFLYCYLDDFDPADDTGRAEAERKVNSCLGSLLRFLGGLCPEQTWSTVAEWYLPPGAR